MSTSFSTISVASVHTTPLSGNGHGKQGYSNAI